LRPGTLTRRALGSAYDVAIVDRAVALGFVVLVAIVALAL
jgi:hypothetical protein